MNKLYRTIFLLLALTFIFGINSPVFAEESKPKEEIKKEIKQDKERLKNDLKELRNATKSGEKNKNQTARIVDAQVTAINGNQLTVSKDGKNYTIGISSKTKFSRHFWGKSSLAEISVGNKVNIWGTWDASKTTIDAKLIRNLSIMKRRGTFLGKIISKDANQFVIQTEKRGNQTVIFDSKTKFVNRKEEKIAYEDLQINDRIRVKGLWDKTLNKITEVSQVKDFSLPVKPTATPTP